MSIYLSNRDGDGQTNEEGHYRFQTQVWSGNAIGEGAKVKQDSPLGMSVLISEGDFKIDTGDGYAYTGWLDADESVSITAADGSNPRIDVVVLYVDKAEATAPSPPNNPGIIKTAVVAGTPAGSPTAPNDAAIQSAVGAGNPFIKLAQVLVGTGVTQITNTVITDVRNIIADPGAIQTSWTPFPVTLSYVSADDPTFVASQVSGDFTTYISPGMRLKLNQTTDKFFIVTAVSALQITMYGGTDYDLANAAISSAYYSMAKAPIGFPLDPTKWTVRVTDTSNRDQATPTASTWYNLGTTNSQIIVPIGAWRISYAVNLLLVVGSVASANAIGYTCLSTANNTRSDAQLSAAYNHDVGITAALAPRALHSRSKDLTLASKTTYYLNAQWSGAGTASLLRFEGAGVGVTTVIEAVSAYL